MPKHRYQELDEPITEEIWERINGLTLPEKVRRLVSIFRARNNEPILTKELPVGLYHSVTQQANATFLHAGIPCRIHSSKSRLHWNARKIKFSMVRILPRGEKNSLPSDAGKEFAVKGTFLVTSEGLIRISLRPSRMGGRVNELNKVIAEIQPKTTRLTTGGELKDEFIIELKGSPKRDQQS